MEEKVNTAGDQEQAGVSIKAALLQGASSIQVSRNIDRVIHQVRTNRPISPKSKTVKYTKFQAKFLKTKKTIVKYVKLKSKYRTATKAHWYNSKFKIK